MLTDSLVTRFLEKVCIPQGDNECWPWNASVNSMGYGHIGEGRRGGRTLYAHRIAWELANGPIPDGLIVRHVCDNPLCVRPSHLEIGTKTDNSHDMARRHRGCRSGTGLPYGVAPHGRGWMAKVREGTRTLYLGTFDTLEAAADAAERERTRLYGPAPETARAA